MVGFHLGASAGTQYLERSFRVALYSRVVAGQGAVELRWRWSLMRRRCLPRTFADAHPQSACVRAFCADIGKKLHMRRRERRS